MSFFALAVRWSNLVGFHAECIGTVQVRSDLNKSTCTFFTIILRLDWPLFLEMTGPLNWYILYDRPGISPRGSFSLVG